ncbi:hypothetical protein [Flexithrix dorotheae]|uniref:hypothetical protein n=1 Tax=Flexithrix dorotheae TaxID=70993 RepID=UPI0003636DAF|nr:hypothetical protein [Flexithrix dorotheae]
MKNNLTITNSPFDLILSKNIQTLYYIQFRRKPAIKGKGSQAYLEAFTLNETPKKPVPLTKPE